MDTKKLDGLPSTIRALDSLVSPEQLALLGAFKAQVKLLVEALPKTEAFLARLPAESLARALADITQQMLPADAVTMGMKPNGVVIGSCKLAVADDGTIGTMLFSSKVDPFLLTGDELLRALSDHPSLVEKFRNNLDQLNVGLTAALNSLKASLGT